MAQGYSRLLEQAEAENIDQGEADRSRVGVISLVGTDYMQACQGAEAVAILTEWDAFKSYDYSAIASTMSSKSLKTIYDFRGILPAHVLSQQESPFDRSFQIGVGWLKNCSS